MIKKTLPRHRWLLVLLFGVLAWPSGSASAQITAPRGFSDGPGSVASLEEQLINRLRATTDQQKGFLRRVSVVVEEGKLEQRLVVAVYRYSLKRNPIYPFPFFERAMRFEARKRGVNLPPVQLIAVTPDFIRSLR